MSKKSKSRQTKKVKRKSSWLTIKELNASKLLPEVITRYQCTTLVKSGDIRSKKVNRKRVFNLQDFIDYYTTIEVVNKDISVTTIKETPYSTFLQRMQAFYGGSTSHASWVDRDKGKHALWSDGRIEHSTKYIKDNAFMDTLIISIPMYFRANASSQFKGGFTFIRTTASKLASDRLLNQTMLKRTLSNNAGFTTDSNKAYAGFVVSELTQEDISNGAVLTSDTPVVKVFMSTSNTTIDFKDGGVYLGYQNYILQASDTPLRQAFEFVKLINEGKFSLYNHSVKVLRFDITTNLPGAVEPCVTKDLSDYGLTIKQNRAYVGETTHSYVILKGHSDIEKRELELEDKRELGILVKELEDLGRYGTINLNLLTENLNQKELVEVKIYDKFRYMLEVGSVTNQYTNARSLYNLTYSKKNEINKAFTELHNVGVSRIESRFRGSSCYSDLNTILSVHSFYAPILTETYSIYTPFQYSVDSFLDTINASVCMVVEPENGQGQSWFGVSHWSNNITKKIQGRHTNVNNQGDKLFGLDSESYLLWKQYQSNRNVPLIEIVCKASHQEGSRLDKSPLNIQEVLVYSPSSVGFSNIIQIGEGAKSRSQSSDKPFYWLGTMGCFKASSVNARSPRPLDKPIECKSLNEALKVAKDKLTKFRYKNKKHQKKRESEYSILEKLFFDACNQATKR